MITWDNQHYSLINRISALSDWATGVWMSEKTSKQTDQHEQRHRAGADS